MAWRTATAVDSYRRETEDRLLIRRAGGRVIVAAADDAGGRCGGAHAAEFAVRKLIECSPDCSSRQLEELISSIDRELTEGETTAVVAVLREDRIVGASVGDSCCWLIGDERTIDLTADQVRKVFVGTGRARPVGFERSDPEGTVLIATDGLIDYTSPEKIVAAARGSDLQAAPRALIDLVRLRSGDLQDDVAVMVARRV
jgi:serine/threonine protein phosphatase PrpC